MTSSMASTPTPGVADLQHTSDNVLQHVSSQKEYLEDLRSRKSQHLVLENLDGSCGICLDSFTEVVAESARHTKNRAKHIVPLKPCQHVFHYGCIIRWHTSIRPERNTCPICRCQLFIADRLTDAQIQLLTNRVRLPSREEAIARLQPNEVLVPWDMVVIIANARRGVQSVIEHVRASRIRRRLWGHPWIALCKTLRDAILLIGGPLRSVFQPHGHGGTFVLALCAAAVLVQITRYPNATRRPAFHRLVDLLDCLMDDIGDEEFQTLYNQFLYGGLFGMDSYGIDRVTNDHIQMQIETTASIRSISAEMENRHGEPKYRGLFRRVAQFVISDIIEKHPERSNKTLSAVLSRMTNGEPPHFLTFIRRRRTSGDPIPDFEWNDVMSLENQSGSTPP